mmetsp:Transcript_44852/g.116304  ORF Transcript_44852/g.116304 Transcript_44852/m.116304 type:complete len:208 (+) Transcript_44852:83-706(+)
MVTGCKKSKDSRRIFSRSTCASSLSSPSSASVLLLPPSSFRGLLLSWFSLRTLWRPKLFAPASIIASPPLLLSSLSSPLSEFTSLELPLLLSSSLSLSSSVSLPLLLSSSLSLELPLSSPSSSPGLSTLRAPPLSLSATARLPFPLRFLSTATTFPRSSALFSLAGEKNLEIGVTKNSILCSNLSGMKYNTPSCSISCFQVSAASLV